MNEKLEKLRALVNDLDHIAQFHGDALRREPDITQHVKAAQAAGHACLDKVGEGHENTGVATRPTNPALYDAETGLSVRVLRSYDMTPHPHQTAQGLLRLILNKELLKLIINEDDGDAMGRG